MSTATQQRGYLTISEVAEMFGVHPSTIRRHISVGDFPAIQFGGRRAAIRIPRSALADLLRRSTVEGRDEP